MSPRAAGAPALPPPGPVEPAGPEDTGPTPEQPESTPAAPPGDDTAPVRGKRPTTRAARAAAAAERKAAQALSRKDSAPSRPKVTASDVKSSVESLHSMIGAGLPLVGLAQTGAAVEASGKDAGEVWADAVKRYPKLEVLFGAGTDGLIVFRLLMVYAPLVQLGMAERSAITAAGGSPSLAEQLAGLTGMGGAGEVPTTP